MTATLAVLRIALMLSACSPLAATAVEGVWAPLGGPAGGTVFSLAVDSASPGAVYVGVFGKGLLKSTDGGARWRSAARGLPPFASPYHLVSDPAHPGALYAGVGRRTWKTIDGGDTWGVLEGEPFVGLAWLVFSSGTPIEAYAFNGSWFASADGGATWQSRGMPPFSFVSCIAVDPGRSGTVAACADQQVFVTGDGGATWTLSVAGLPNDDEVQGLVFDPGDAGRLFAWMAYSGVFRSDDAGGHWRPAGLASAAGDVQLWALAAAADGSRLYAGTRRRAAANSGVAEVYEIYVRERGEPSWHLAGPAMASMPAPPLFLTTDPVDPLTLRAGTWGRGLALSRDGGVTWTYQDAGFDAASIGNLIADPRHRGVYFAGDQDARIWRSGDDASTWEPFAEGLGAILAIDPRRPHTLYAGGPSRSDDGGRHWTNLAQGDLFFCQYFQRMVVDPFDSTLYVLFEGNNGLGCHNPGSFIYKSVDRGGSWQPVPEPTCDVSDLAIGAQRSERAAAVLFALTYAGVERSLDGGNTWSTSTQGLGLLDGAISTAVSANSQILYLNGRGGVFRSVDGAVSWLRTGPEIVAAPDFLTLAVDPFSSQTVYGYLYGGRRFFRSVNGGATWNEFSDGLGGTNLISPLAFDSLHPGRIVAGTDSAGVMAIQLPPESSSP